MLGIVNNSIQYQLLQIHSKFNYSFLRLPKLKARNFAGRLATFLLVHVLLGVFFGHRQCFRHINTHFRAKRFIIHETI